VQVGDLVARMYGEGQRPTAILIDLQELRPYSHAGGRIHMRAKVLWSNGDIGRISAKYLEVISRKNEKTS